tara:strand:+ start:512 stop:703 length:192 start_codon:yes stop_codon:yes gene_type:complete
MSKLTKCLDCKKEISADAEKCPHCGSANPTNWQLWSKAIIGIFIIYVLAKWYFEWETNFLYFI